MAVRLVTEEERAHHSTVVGPRLITLSVPASGLTPRLDDLESAVHVPPTQGASATRWRLLFRELSRAMTAAYVITPPFGSAYLRTPSTDGEHTTLQH